MSLREAAEMHTLKTDPEAFQAVIAGRKTYEIRFDDRGFKVGDRLNLLETASTGAEMKAGAPLEYTGGQFWAKVTHILRGPVYGLAEGWVILSIVEDMAGSFNPDEMRAELAKPDAPAAAPDCDVMPQAFAEKTAAQIKLEGLREALFRLWPAVEKAMAGLVFTADRAGDVAADMSTIRAAIVPEETAPGCKTPAGCRENGCLGWCDEHKPEAAKP